MSEKRDFYPRSPCGERPYIIRHTINLQPISIHALLAESDCFFCAKLLLQLTFLSTLSLRRATTQLGINLTFDVNFYPRSPCGERRSNILKTSQNSIYFYPRSPCGERRQLKQTCRAEISISIHALLAESDNECTSLAPKPKTFLSTLSLRRATLQWTI